MNKNNIKRSISECKWYFGISIGIFILFAISLSLVAIIAIGWWGILFGFGISFLFLLVNQNSCYFTFQESTINLSFHQVTKSESKMSYVCLKVKGDSDELGYSICQVTFIDGKNVDGIVVKLPNSEIFKKEKFFWKQKFKPLSEWKKN